MNLVVLLNIMKCVAFALLLLWLGRASACNGHFAAAVASCGLCSRAHSREPGSRSTSPGGRRQQACVCASVPLASCCAGGQKCAAALHRDSAVLHHRSARVLQRTSRRHRLCVCVRARLWRDSGQWGASVVIVVYIRHKLVCTKTCGRQFNAWRRPARHKRGSEQTLPTRHWFVS